MDDLLSLLTFVGDLACAMTRLNEIEGFHITPGAAVAVHYGALGALFLSVFLSETKGFGVLLLLAVGAICSFNAKNNLAFAPAMLMGMFPVTVVAFRGAEGAMIGIQLRERFRSWVVIPLLCVAVGIPVGLFFALKAHPETSLVGVKTAWAVFVAIVAAYSWTRQLEGVGGAFGSLAVFVVFLSLYLYPPLHPGVERLFQWVCPAGFLVGFLGGKRLESFAVRRTLGVSEADQPRDSEAAQPRDTKGYRRLGCVALLVILGVAGWLVLSSRSPEGRFGSAPKHPAPIPADKPNEPAKEITVDLGGGITLEMVLIPAGEFMMGSPDSDQDYLSDEKPQHRVRVTKRFFLGTYPVTQEQWEAVMGNNPSHVKGPKNPVENVSWDDCQKFLERLNAKVGGGRFSLPTEAQWEYACRAGSSARYCFGDDASDLGEYAWYRESSADQSHHPVGQKKPNAWGLYDMHGNVWEWCQDWYRDDYYKESPVDDPAGPATSTWSGHVFRGGWWSPARLCRSASRSGFLPGNAHGLGLRLSKEPE